MVIRSMRSRNARRPAILNLQPETIDAVAQAWEDQPNQSEHLLALESFLQRLNPQQRKLVMLRYADGLPNQEIAERTGRALPGVTKALQRLRQALVNCVQGRLHATSSGTHL